MLEDLKCRECGKRYPAQPVAMCEECFGPLEVTYDYLKVSETLTNESIRKRDENMWRYRELLPSLDPAASGTSVGFTPLVRAKNLEKFWGLKELYIKNDAVNFPTLSFKDRVVSVAISKAIEFGFKVVGCASTGNLANAVAAQATASGLQTCILVPADLEPAKITGTFATEAIKWLLGIGTPLVGRLLLYDALQSTVRTYKLHKNPKCPVVANILQLQDSKIWNGRAGLAHEVTRMIVMKFGGTSFTEVATWQRVLSIVQTRTGQLPVIVASAIRGMTDELAACAENASIGDRLGVQRGFERIASTHFEACEGLRLGKQVRQQLGEKVRELKLCLESVVTLNELTARTRDQILAYGEILSSILLASFLQKQGLNASLVDSRDLLITNDRFSSAVPLTKPSRERTRNRILPLLRNDRIPVLSGFIGATEKGHTTTIGRGGSDYSASLFAGWLEADVLEIWKDVPGFMTADPRIVPEAETIPFLSYAEAEQLCRYGAKFLHPMAVRFAARKKISIRVLYTANPEEQGTLISFDTALPAPPVLAIAAQKQSGRVIVVGDGLRDPSIAAQILGSCRGLEILRISQDMLRSRMIVVTAHGEDTDRAIRQIHESVKAIHFEF